MHVAVHYLLRIGSHCASVFRRFQACGVRLKHGVQRRLANVGRLERAAGGTTALAVSLVMIWFMFLSDVHTTAKLAFLTLTDVPELRAANAPDFHFEWSAVHVQCGPRDDGVEARQLSLSVPDRTAACDDLVLLASNLGGRPSLTLSPRGHRCAVLLDWQRPDDRPGRRELAAGEECRLTLPPGAEPDGAVQIIRRSRVGGLTGRLKEPIKLHERSYGGRDSMVELTGVRLELASLSWQPAEATLLAELQSDGLLSFALDGRGQIARILHEAALEILSGKEVPVFVLLLIGVFALLWRRRVPPPVPRPPGPSVARRPHAARGARRKGGGPVPPSVPQPADPSIARQPRAACRRRRKSGASAR